MSLAYLAYEQQNLENLKKIKQIREKTWTLVLENNTLHDTEIDIYDSKCPGPGCNKIISHKLKQCPHCDIVFSSKKIKKLEKKKSPSKGVKYCEGCSFYVGVRTFNCDCGYDFKTKIKNESTITNHFKNIKRKKSVKIKIADIVDLNLLLLNDIQSSNILKLNKCGVLEIEKLVSDFISTRNDMIKFNNKLTISLARKWSKACKHLTINDLIQEAFFGMVAAINHFDVNQTTKLPDGTDKIISFSTYATWWINKTIIESINKREKEIRIPDHVKNQYREYKKFYEDYKTEYESEPSIEAIQKALDIGKKKAESLVFARQYSMRTSILLEDITKFVDSEGPEKSTFKGSLYLLKNGGLESFGLVDTIPENKIDLLNINWGIIRFIKPHYRKIFYQLKGLFGEEEKSVAELSEEHGLTKVTVYKIKNDTMRSLKNQLNRRR